MHHSNNLVACSSHFSECLYLNLTQKVAGAFCCNFRRVFNDGNSRRLPVDTFSSSGCSVAFNRRKASCEALQIGFDWVTKVTSLQRRCDDEDQRERRLAAYQLPSAVARQQIN